MSQNEVFELIAASGPFAELSEALMLYGQFVGSWDIQATWYEPDGARRTGKGEWHFRWILGGRGIQDILFACEAAPYQFGTTLRCYDREMDAWHITWMQPAGGEFVHLIGRKVGDRIVQEGLSSDPRRQERWSFLEITETSFLWTGEVSFDKGLTWVLEQELRATRQIP